MVEKRNDLINRFTKRNIISKNVKFAEASKKSEESISKKLKQESNQLIPKWVEVSEDRFNFIKLKINLNKKLSTTTDRSRYTINHANELVNKIAEKKLAKIMPLKHKA